MNIGMMPQPLISMLGVRKQVGGGEAASKSGVQNGEPLFLVQFVASHALHQVTRLRG